MLLSDSFASLPRAAQRSPDAGFGERLAARVAEELPGVELDPRGWLCFAGELKPRSDPAIVLRCSLAPVITFLQVLQQRDLPLPGTRRSPGSSSASQTAAIEAVLRGFGPEYRLADSADEALVQRWKRKQAAPGVNDEADAADAGRRSSRRDQSGPAQQPSAASAGAAAAAAAGAAAKAADAAAQHGRGRDQAQDERKRTSQQQQQQEEDAGEEQQPRPKKQKIGDLNELSLGKNRSNCEQQRMQPPPQLAAPHAARAGSGSSTGSTSTGTKAAAVGAAASGRRRKAGSSLRAAEELDQQLRWQQRWAPKPPRASATSRATAAPASPAAARKAATAAAEARRKAAAESAAAGVAASAGLGAGITSSSGGTARQRKRAAAAAVVAAATARAAAAAQAAKRPRLAQQQAAAARRSAAAAGGGTRLQDSSRLPDGRLPSPQALQQLAAQVSAELPGAVLGPGWQVYPALQGGSSSVAPKKDVCICHPDLTQGFFRSAKSVVTFLAASVAQMDARGISRKDTAVPGLAVLPAPAARAAARGVAAKPAQQQRPSSGGRLLRQQRGGSSAAAGTSAAAAAAAVAAEAAKAPLPPAALRAALKAASGGFVFKGISSISSKRGGRGAAGAASVGSLHPAERELALREGRSWVHPPIDATHGRPKKGPVLVLAMFFANAEVADASHEGLAQHRDRARLLELQQGGGYTAHSFDRDHREDEAEGRQHVRGNFNSLRGARDVAARFPGVKFKAIFLDYFRVPSGYAASMYKPQLFTQFIPELVRAGAVSPGVPVYIPNNEALLHQLATASAFSCYSGFVAVPAARYPLYAATGRAEASGTLGGEYTNSSEVRELVEGSEFVVVRCTGVAAPPAAAAAAAAESDALGSSSGPAAAAAGPAGQAVGCGSGPPAAGRAEAGAAGGSSGPARLQAARTRRGRPPLATGRADV